MATYFIPDNCVYKRVASELASNVLRLCGERAATEEGGSDLYHSDVLRNDTSVHMDIADDISVHVGRVSHTGTKLLEFMTFNSCRYYDGNKYCITVPACDGIPYFRGITGKAVVDLGDGVDRKVQLDAHLLRKAASTAWKACGGLSLEYKTRAFHWIMSAVEIRELLCWCIEKAKNGTLPKRLRTHRVSLKETKVDLERLCSRVDVMPIPESMHMCFSCSDNLKFTHLIPLYDKFMGSIGSVDKYGYKRCIGYNTPAFFIASTAGSSKPGWSLYFYSNASCECLTFVKHGKGSIQDNTKRIIEAARQFVTERLLGEHDDAASRQFTETKLYVANVEAASLKDNARAYEVALHEFKRMFVRTISAEYRSAVNTVTAEACRKVLAECYGEQL